MWSRELPQKKILDEPAEELTISSNPNPNPNPSPSPNLNPSPNPNPTPNCGQELTISSPMLKLSPLYLPYISLYLAYISPISRQELTISSPMLNATIWSAPANKFYAKEKQLKFAHLNVDLNWAKGSASGLLTELAGDRPMSRASRMLLKSPLDAKAPDGKPQITIEP